MKHRNMKKYLAFAMAVIMIICTSGCALPVNAENMMDGITANEVEVLTDLSAGTAAATDFALRLFQASNQLGENTLISPLSVLYALAITANGAEGETLAQMEQVLGAPVADLNSYLFSYMRSLPQGEKYKLSVANSIWFTEDDRFTVSRDFLQTNADYYGADIYRAPFDNTTLTDINNWVNMKTDGMIPDILDKIPQEAVMYLVNALAFEAEWEVIYNENSVNAGIFTREDGTQVECEFMFSEEGCYLEDENVTGFIKYYSGREYAFVALLPREGLTVEQYLDSMTGASFQSLLNTAQYIPVNARLPKFKTETSLQMGDILMGMGMPKAFSQMAEFTKMGYSTAGPLHISRVIHKTFISVAEQGTRAGAATLVEITDEGMVIDPKSVNLNRPFVYMLIDVDTGLPFFIGTMMDVTQ